MENQFSQQDQEAQKSEETIFASKSLQIVAQIQAMLSRQGKTQKDLATAMGKSEAEVSKWLSGLQNLTLRSIAKMEAALNEEILIAPMYWKEYRGMFARRNTPVALYPPVVLQASFSVSFMNDIVPETIAEKPQMGVAYSKPGYLRKAN